jgi:phage terminase small subunit
MGARGPRKKWRPGEPMKAGGGSERPEKPPHVAEDPVASKAFDDVVVALEEMRILRKSHEMPLALFATEWSRHVFAARVARAEPIVVGPRGSKANPAAGVASQAARVALDLLRDFGLTPAALGRVDMPPAEDPAESEIERFRRLRDDMRAKDSPKVVSGMSVLEMLGRGGSKPPASP